VTVDRDQGPGLPVCVPRAPRGALAKCARGKCYCKGKAGSRLELESWSRRRPGGRRCSGIEGWGFDLQLPRRSFEGRGLIQPASARAAAGMA
jgi:hypothetical protein